MGFRSSIGETSPAGCPEQDLPAGWVCMVKQRSAGSLAAQVCWSHYRPTDSLYHNQRASSPSCHMVVTDRDESIALFDLVEVFVQYTTVCVSMIIVLPSSSPASPS